MTRKTSWLLSSTTNPPQLSSSLNILVGGTWFFTVRTNVSIVPYDHPHSPGDQQFAYKTVLARQQPTNLDMH